MGDKDTTFSDSDDVFGNILYVGRIADSVVIDTRQACDECRDLTAGIHEGSEFLNDPAMAVFKNGDLGDLVSPDAISGGLYVYDTIHLTDLFC